MSYFNVRVYGLLINHLNQVLISDEQEYGMQFTKFPGGGVELGEGPVDGLKREFMEECGLEIEVLAHFFTTDFYEPSSFNESQVISIYYLVKELSPLQVAIKTAQFDFEGITDPQQSFRWLDISTITTGDVTFKTDKKVVELLMAANPNHFIRPTDSLQSAPSNLAARDKKVVWHPYTQMQNALPHIPITRGEGVYVFDENGNKYLDAISSWWVNIHGHAHPYIAQKVSEQLYTLEHVIFAGFTHEPAVALAEQLLEILPGKQEKVFYSDNGSTAVEVALKMCLQYWLNCGTPRTKVLAFKNAYHGDTFGAMSVSGRSIFTEAFDSLLFDVEFIDVPNAENISNLRSVIRELKDEAACFIFEPLVQGSAGMLMYEAKYLDALVACCNENGILAIADEVFTGFGRTGTYFACEQINSQADIFCLSKGLTGGTMPLGVTTCTTEIFNAFLSDDKAKTLYHGHSFTANPLACTAALASMDILLNAETPANMKRISDRHTVFLHKIKDHPKVKSVRQTGTIIAIEWNTTENTSYLSNIRNILYDFFLKKGIIMRPLGNIIYILPPYVITDAQLEYIYQMVAEALETI